MIPDYDAAHRPLDDATDALPNPALEELQAEVEALREAVRVLRKAGLAVEQWWLVEEMPMRIGAPACIFMTRAALAATEAHR